MDKSLNFLGRGSAFNTKEGCTSAYYIIGNELYLFDCGFDIFQKIKDKKLLKAIKHVYIFITHLHADHSGSLAMLIEYCNQVKNIIPNIIYPDEMIVTFLALQDIKSTQYELIKPNIIDMNKESRTFNNTKVNSKKIFCYKNNHTNNSFSYCVDFPRTKIFYSGDCAGYPDKIIENLTNIQLYGYTYELEIYIECSYYNSEHHIHVTDLIENISKDYRSYVKYYVMHIDSDNLFELLEVNNINIVDLD